MDHQAHQGHQEVADELDRLARMVVDAGLKVHRALGPGLLETAYEHCLAHELAARGLPVRRQVVLPIVYEGLKLDAGYRLDLLVAERLVVEVKAVDALTRLHEAQLLTYLKLSQLRLGLLMNFNVALFKKASVDWCFGHSLGVLGVLGVLGGSPLERRSPTLKPGLP